MPDKRDLTPEQEARVARLLAEARAEGPMPPDVADRLDGVLAGLADEPVAGPVDGPEQTPAAGDELAARRRRRVRILLAAAAAVVVAGVGIGQLVEPMEDGGPDSAGVAESDDNGGGQAPEEAPRQATPDEDVPGSLTEGELGMLDAPARITGSSFAAAVRRLQDRPGVRGDARSGTLDGTDLAAPESDFSCGPADFGPGKLLAVRYNGTPAVLAYRPPAGGTQVVELLQCGSGDIMRSITVPLP